MRIAFLSVMFRHPESSQKRGGGEISNRFLLESLAASHSVCVVCAVGTGLWGEKVNGVRYYDLSVLLGKRWFGGVATGLAKLFFTTLVPIVLLRFKPSVVLVSTLEHSAALRYRRWAGVPVGGFLRAYENFRLGRRFSAGSVKARLQQLLYGNFHQRNVNRLDFVLPNSRYFAGVCRKEFPGPRQYVVYPPVNVERVKASRFDGSMQCLGMVSNAEHKGGRLFVKLAECFPDMEFHVIGFREEYAEAGDRDIPNLVCHEWAPDVARILGQMDVVLVPSQWQEPFGRVAVEALQAGSCVLVSDAGGLPEAVGDCKALIVSAKDTDAWEKRLLEIKADPTEFLAQNEEARLLADRFRLSRQAAAFENVLEQEVSRFESRIK